MTEMNIESVVFHHVGILVSSIEETKKDYSVFLGAENIGRVFTIKDQKVKMCFINLGNENYIELVEPLSDNLPLIKSLKKGMNYYHTAYRVNNIEFIINLLEPKGYKFLNSFESEAFHMNRCIFSYSPDLHLLEFIEN